MSGLRPDADRYEYAERSKIMVGRAPGQNGRGPGALWWRVTIYAGDTREEIDQALDEALRVDDLLRKAGEHP
jgi:hypothetical protein